MSAALQPRHRNPRKEKSEIPRDGDLHPCKPQLSGLDILIPLDLEPRKNWVASEKLNYTSGPK